MVSVEVGEPAAGQSGHALAADDVGQPGGAAVEGPGGDAPVDRVHAGGDDVEGEVAVAMGDRIGELLDDRDGGVLVQDRGAQAPATIACRTP